VRQGGGGHWPRNTALVLEALAEEDAISGVATWCGALAGERRFRVGVADNCKVDNEVADALDKAVATIQSMGHSVSHASAPLTDFRKDVDNIESDRRAIGQLAFNNIDVLVLPTTATATPTCHECRQEPTRSIARTDNVRELLRLARGKRARRFRQPRASGGITNCCKALG
jgi:Asp-tRNA(Asn)/Glu-tRNA(Gln) amidotransferase A subunit family amidase